VAADKYVIDPEHVWVNFSIQQNVWARNVGRFNKIKGEILFNKNNVSASSVVVEIAAGSVDTANLSRDYEVKQSFLSAAIFPKITFVSTSVEKTSDNEGTVIGDLTVAGMTKPVTLHVIFDGEAISMFNGKMTAGFSADGELNTDDFGIQGLTALGIHPQVRFTIEADAILE
jgi:polyisoprenoid-binding protein YceI